VKYLFALGIALSLTLAWQTASLENRSSELQSVENEEAIRAVPPQAT
jgi:hypothetical protein